MGWMVLSVFDLANAFLPVTPWSLPVLLTFLAIVAIVYARTLPKRLEQRRVPALEAVRAIVMAKSLIATGALLAGGHVIYVGRFHGRRGARGAGLARSRDHWRCRLLFMGRMDTGTRLHDRR